MPFFSKVFKPKDGAKAKGGKYGDFSDGTANAPPKPRWQESWSWKQVSPDQVQELIHVCTQELKSRALDTPFLLLPFRPGADSTSARHLITNFFKDMDQGGSMCFGDGLRNELRLTEPMVLCSIMKWCWSRLPGGVVTWDAYELFRVGEQDSGMAKHSFDTFIPLSVESEARRQIIMDFFDLLAAVAARGKTNGLGGRKLSRMAGWWAFEHADLGKGFEGGYKTWAQAADATSHLFFAYLRSLAPEDKIITGISNLPRSLQALLNQTEYPPEPPTLMLTSTTKVVLIVDSVSPTPFALLRRAKNFEYRESDRVLREFAYYDDPVQTLSDECRRVLKAISTANGATVEVNGSSDPSWSKFEDLGFGFLDDTSVGSGTGGSTNSSNGGLRTTPRSMANELGRPTTPSWADFLSSGFTDDKAAAPRPPMLLPPDKQLPPIGEVTRVQSSQSHLRHGETAENLEPGEVASINKFDLDETFFWVWITSLAPEEPNERKAVFGRCALVETKLAGGRWLVVEEQIKGATPGPEEGAYVVEKKSKFSFGRRRRRKSTGKKPAKEPYDRKQNETPMSKTSIGPDQHAKIQAAAANLALQQRQQGSMDSNQRRGRDDATSTKTNSVMTLQPLVASEAGPAMKWARNFDKEALRAQYLGDNAAGTGKGFFHENLSSANISNGAISSPEPVASRKDTPEPNKSKELPRKPVQSNRDSWPVPYTHYSPSSPARPSHEQPVSVEDGHPSKNTAQRPDKAAAAPTGLAERRKKFEQPDPATVAAQKAFEHGRTSPEAERKPEHKKLKKPTQNTGGGFKRLFTKRQKENPLQRNKTPDPTAADTGAGFEAQQRESTSRPNSNQRQVAATPEPPAHAPPPPPPEPIQKQPENEAPTMRKDAIVYDHDRPVPVSRVHTREQEEAEQQFSNFDQGPDDNSYGTDYTDEEPSPSTPPAQKSYTHASRPGQAQHTTAGYDASQAESSEYASSEASMHDAQQAIPPTQDRWAQIRKNAAERAMRVSEDRSTRPRHSESVSMKTEDGETSGEETIEDRVARIKARVAELTGNMDSSGKIVTGARR
ncbi:uncharacterized protein J3D65DRAFT_209784 [Phyllosticta citribraziliensis]|uniref:Meiotically up-regulated protein Msb1/Mug8 domain-containing protein n=1 Tax=Phyllosticta citribraziliensis TaxID=989973 RepID=A0ABR1M5M7_9PEZI